MGYDRIRYFEGADGESTLIAADKASSNVVYGYKFCEFAQRIGLTATRVVDIGALADNPWLQEVVNNRQAKVAEFPATARREWFDHCLANDAIELRPPISDEQLIILNAFLQTMCEPSDSCLIIDNRGPHERQIASF